MAWLQVDLRSKVSQTLSFTEHTFSPCGLSVVFFFQAEDGIRDSSVTGVQTCALPIYSDVQIGLIIQTGGLIAGGCARGFLFLRRINFAATDRRIRNCRASGENRKSRNRSEERRVGKECRSRWSPYH